MLPAMSYFEAYTCVLVNNAFPLKVFMARVAYLRSCVAVATLFWLKRCNGIGSGRDRISEGRRLVKSKQYSMDTAAAQRHSTRQ